MTSTAQVQRFVDEARRYERWVLESTSEGSTAAREALLLLTALYGAALELPSADPAETDEAQDRQGVSDEEHRRVFLRGGRLPFNYYSGVPDLFVVPAEETVVDDLADDLADIYRDVVRGLRLFDGNHHAAAVWNWSFGFGSHWGRHAASAIHALHCWIEQNDRDLLRAPK